MSCERCGFDNPAGFRFCGACGAVLQRPEEGVHEEERKVISTLFCDIVGSTTRAEGRDPEDVWVDRAAFYRGVRAQLVRFGGTVEKHIGDAVCCLFGAPKAYGDDTERAVRAALAIRDWIVEHNDASPERAFHVRLGVATGEALVALGARSSEGEGMAWGDVMNTAARLQTAAPPDGVLVDQRTYQATRHVIEYADHQTFTVKGKAEPILVWQAVAPLARRGIDLSQAGDEPFVGRADELVTLRQSLDRVGRLRAPELITLVGEAGIGKSRLVFELFRWIELSPALVVRWRQARTSPYGDVLTYGALAEIVKAQAGILETDGRSVVREKLRRAVNDLVPSSVDANQIESHLRSLVGLRPAADPHGDQREAAFSAWRRFLEAMAAQYPLVLVFEDIHWADAELLDFIEHVLEWARDVRILIICTARPEFIDARHAWADSERATKIPVSPLSSEDTGELVAKLAPTELAPETREAIVGSAAGNPLFAVEFVRMLAEHPEHPPTADSVRAVIAARVDSLPAETKRLLHAAAVVGRVVWPGALARIVDASRRSVDRQLRELVRREFLTRLSPSSVEGESEFGFRHALVREVAYEQIPRPHRAEIHRRAAEWLESLNPDGTTDRAEMLAVHYGSAHEYALAAGEDTADLAEGARLALREAGNRALSLNAFAAAERHYLAAIDLWPGEDADWPSLLLHLGKARYYAHSEGADELAAAERMLLEAGDSESAAEAAVLLADLAHHRGEPKEKVFQHAFRAYALVEGLEASRSKIEVLIDLSNFLTLAADQEGAISLATDALHDAEALELRELEARALAILGMARGLSGDSGGRVDLQRSVELTEEIDSPNGSHHCGMLADLECSLGNLEQCFELQARARGHAERLGHASHVQWLRAELVGEYYWSGRWDEALDLANDFLAEAGSGHFMEPYSQAIRGRILLARGDIAGGLDDTAGALDKARGSEEPQMLCPALAVRARALIAAGALDDANRIVDELLALWSDKLNLFLASAWVIDLAWALDDLGRGHELAEIAEGVLARTAWLEAALACTTGRFDVAAELLAGIGSGPDEALARLRSAQARSAPELEDDARRDLEFAVSFFREVQATEYLRDAEHVLVP